MGKGQRSGKKHKAWSADEAFTAGPLRLERYGRLIRGRADWAPGAHDRFIGDLAARCDDVVAEIDGLVAEVATTVARLDPLELLHRAWWERSAGHITIEAEIEVGREDALAMRMVDYVQSVIAGT